MTESRTISVEGQPFYMGVAAAAQINEAHAEQPGMAQLDDAGRSRLFWFYAGGLAVEKGLTEPDQFAQFIAGASTRSPENSRPALPDDWPDELTPEQQDALDNLVHDAASQPASRINNDGPDAQLRYLLDQGVGYHHVREEIGL
jgi:hypothetical protein